MFWSTYLELQCYTMTNVGLIIINFVTKEEINENAKTPRVEESRVDLFVAPMKTFFFEFMLSIR